MLTRQSINELDVTEGTVKLVDASHRLKSKKNSDIVLIPQPTDDPNDPLNWPYWKKTVAFVPISIFSLASGWIVGGLGSGLVLLMNEFHTDLNVTVDALMNWPVLLLGLGVFIWVPAILYFGTRPAALTGTLLLFASLIWGAITHNFHSLEASRIISALALCCGEVLPSIAVKDLFFLHERGWWMGVYMVFFQCLPNLGIIISGFTISGLGWRWHLWLLSIVVGVDFLVIFFFFPETQYRRDSPGFVPDLSISGKETTSYKVQEISIPKKKSFIQELNPWSGINPGIERKTGFLFLCIRPWPLIVYPAVIFSFLVFSFNLACVLMVVNTAASVFQASPYNMTPGIQSLIFVSGIIGAAIGAYMGGALTDKFIEYRTKKNNGIFEPETRLVALIFPLFIVPAGVLMYGFGVAHTTSWAVPFIGLGLISFGLSNLPTISMAYVVDCYYPAAADLMLLIIGLKNVFGFAFAYSIIPWLNHWGFARVFGTMAGIMFGIVLLGLPLWYWGKLFRHVSAKWKIIMTI